VSVSTSSSIKVKLVPFRIEWDWLPGSEQLGSDPDRAYRATWARLTITAGAARVTQLVSAGAGSYRDSVEAPMYPLAEWIAFNWWSLVADARPGTMISQLRFAYKNGVADQRGAWIQRPRTHVLRAAGGGPHWPDMLFVPEGRQTRVVWMADPMPTGSQRPAYVGSGNVVVPSSQFVDALGGFVDAVVERLDAQGVAETALQQEWAAVRGTPAAEAEYCRRAAQLGLDPYAAAEEYGAEIARVADELPPEMVFDFFNGVGRNRLRERAEWVRQARRRIGNGASDKLPDSIRELREICADLRELMAAPDCREDPWDIGAETARRVRAWAGVRDTDAFEPEPFMSYDVVATDYLDRGLVALGALTGAAGPTLLTARPYDDRPRRFLQCRALWHFVCGTEPEFLIVAAHTHRQHVARGFALEALAPATGVARQLADPAHLVTAEDVEQIADRYLCGNIVVEHQLDNRVTALDFRWDLDPAALAETAFRATAERV
jgi:hypothetical protein